MQWAHTHTHTFCSSLVVSYCFRKFKPTRQFCLHPGTRLTEFVNRRQTCPTPRVSFSTDSRGKRLPRRCFISSLAMNVFKRRLTPIRHFDAARVISIGGKKPPTGLTGGRIVCCVFAGSGSLSFRLLTAFGTGAHVSNAFTTYSDDATHYRLDDALVGFSTISSSTVMMFGSPTPTLISNVTRISKVSLAPASAVRFVCSFRPYTTASTALLPPSAGKLSQDLRLPGV